MFFLPYDYFEIYTTLTPDEIQQRLSKVIEPWQLLTFDSNKYFEGQLTKNKFKISRRIWYNNSFRPVILGEICPDIKGSRIKISMRLHWLVFFFSTIFLFVLGMAILSAVSDWLIFVLQIKFTNVNEEFLSGMSAFVFMYLLTLVSYKIEARIAKKMLFIIFEAESKENVIYYNKFAGLNQFQQISLLIIMAIVLTFLVSLIKFFLL